MDTPWGPLSQLDLSDHDLGQRILSADKHQLVEGLVVECLFDQIVSCVPATATHIVPLDVETVTVHNSGSAEPWLAFVWPRTRTAGLGRYLSALGTSFATYVLELQDGQFRAARFRYGRRAEEWRVLADLMHQLSRKRHCPFVVDESVKDAKRQRQAFWGFLSDYYGPELGSRVIMPRLLINCAIQPYFRSLWNLDRVFVANDEIWLFEIKHKYPISGQKLGFGINEGELRVIDRLASAGIRCLHTVLVKPVWDRNVGSMYLLNDLTLRARAGVIATVLDASRTGALLRSGSGRSGLHTSITGSSTISYKTLSASTFRYLGVLSDKPATLAAEMVSTIQGGERPVLEDKLLWSLKTVLGQSGPEIR